jgi:hypothetical protein
MLLVGGVAVGEITALEKVEEVVVMVAVVVALVIEELDEIVAGPSANTPPDADGEVLAELAPSANTPALVVVAVGAAAVTAPEADMFPKSL